jgi:D-ribulokinase
MTVFIGVDVGTGSARAGVFESTGDLLASNKQDIKMWRTAGDIVEQSSDDIWQAVCHAVRTAVAKAGVSPDTVRGIGFDAACSMVVLDRDMAPLSVSASGASERNVIVWMDHRATEQAERINTTGAPGSGFRWRAYFARDANAKTALAERTHAGAVCGGGPLL